MQTETIPHISPPQQRVLSGWWRRVGATVLDFLIIGMISMAVVVPLVFTGALSMSASHEVTTAENLIVAAITLAIITIYFGYLMSRQGINNGQTIGKEVAGIRVVRRDNRPVGFGFAVVREILVKVLLFGIVGKLSGVSLLGSLPGLLDRLWPLWDRENRAIHDMIVSTHVVRANTG